MDLRLSSNISIAMCEILKGFPGGAMVEKLLANAGDIKEASSIPGSGRPPREWHDNPLQYSCLENPMEGWKDPLEEEMASHSSILAEEIP